MTRTPLITRQNITRRVKSAAQADRIIITHHARERMVKRGVTEKQVREVARSGVQIETKPPENAGQNPTTKMYKRVAGDDINIVASIVSTEKGESVIVITTIPGR